MKSENRKGGNAGKEMASTSAMRAKFPCAKAAEVGALDVRVSPGAPLGSSLATAHHPAPLGSREFSSQLPTSPLLLGAEKSSR